MGFILEAKYLLYDGILTSIKESIIFISAYPSMSKAFEEFGEVEEEGYVAPFINLFLIFVFSSMSMYRVVWLHSSSMFAKRSTKKE